MTGSALMPRASIHQLVAAKDAALAGLGAAWEALERANELARIAAPSGLTAFPFFSGGSPYGRSQSTFRDRAEFDHYSARVLNQAVWQHVVRATQLDQLMDRQERDAFRGSLDADPPPATVENIAATVERLLGDADLIFNRGIANAFSALDRRFRSHDGFKVGARIVLSGAFSEFGTWNHYRNHDDTLIDVERTFARLDGEPQPERYGGIVGAINAAKPRGLRLHAFEAESTYFRVKVFGNGNAHVWFKRADLVAKVNELLADYYGSALGAGADVAEKRRGTSAAVAKNMGWFPTPEAVARRVISEAKVWTPETYSGEYPKLRILEPSAGVGALAGPCVEAGHSVTCVELHPERAFELKFQRRFARVLQSDFLAVSPAALGERFDRIVMNPPFDRGLDVDHVSHALGFLAPGGILVAVMSASVEFRQNRRTSEFRERIARMGGHFSDLPPGSFAEVGTNVNTMLLTVRAAR